MAPPPATLEAPPDDGRARDARGGADPDQVVRKVMRRLIPFMCFLYLLNYVDRVNINTAKFQMNAALGLTEAQYGLAAGMFFVGYCLFEVPSNLILLRVGARRWIARIMVSWGVVSALMCLVVGAKSFYLLRLLLGVAEAGFFPGMVLYLAAWIPSGARARALAWFLTSTALAGVVGNPLTGKLLELSGLGLAGWQWAFLLEGIPTVIFGVVTWFALTDRPADARWLTPPEKRALADALAADRSAADDAACEHRLWPAMRNRAVWLMSTYYSLVIFGFYAIQYWSGSVIREVQPDATPFRIGLLNALPFVAATVGMVVAGAVTDRTGRRRTVLAVCTALGVIGTLAAPHSASVWVRTGCLGLAAAGIWGTLGPFWVIPHTFLRGPAAAAGVALVNSVGNLIGGFVGPTAIGYLRQGTSDFRAGFALAAGVLLAATLLTGCLPSGAARPAAPAPRDDQGLA